MQKSDASSLQAYGQAQYRRANFHRALAAFTKATNQALQLGGGDTVGILDNRAATHCKLQVPKSGLQDGKRMIEENKMDSRGYLRTAKILQLMGRSDKAIQTYQYALRVLPLDDPGRQLWIHLDLSKANKPNVSLKSIQAFLRRSHWRLTRASLVNLQPVDFPRLMAGLRQIPSLEHLELLGSFSSKFDVAPVYTLTGLRTLVCSASSEMTLAHFRKVLLDCPLLERVEVYIKPAPFSDVETFPAKLPNLRSLIILGIDYPRYSNDPSTLNLPFPTNATLFDIIPNLEEFYLICNSVMIRNVPEVSNLPKLKRFGLLGIKLNKYPELPESLEHLSLSMSDYNLPLGVPSNDISAMAPNLKTLILHRFQDDELGPFLISFTQSKSSLTHLDLEGCHLHVEDLLIAMMRGNLEGLTYLNISGLAEIDDKVISNIIDMVPNIKELNISRTQVKEHSVKKLLDSDKSNLKKLVVHKMETPFSRDFLDYARSKGVEIPPPINLKGTKRAPVTPTPRR
ncbi:F-box domain-containing protein [Histoplasma capsulatum]|uniref:F-box domain-containing protein n=1 Tax=Ajellomyces capsulatus TaxID=5037 RepID=A0A8A1MB68_AJECA|nr:F-box domain-containing protein [Histoplasma capsulatum]